MNEWRKIESNTIIYLFIGGCCINTFCSYSCIDTVVSAAEYNDVKISFFFLFFCYSVLCYHLPFRLQWYLEFWVDFFWDTTRHQLLLLFERRQQMLILAKHTWRMKDCNSCIALLTWIRNTESSSVPIFFFSNVDSLVDYLFCPCRITIHTIPFYFRDFSSISNNFLFC